MSISSKITEFISSIQQALADDTFVSVSMGNYKGQEENLKNIYVKKAIVKQEVKLSFTYRYKTKDIVKNYAVNDGVELINKGLSEGFKVATLFTTAFDTIFENFNDKKVTIRKTAPVKAEAPSLEHDRNKQRLIAAKGKQYLAELHITDKDGNVLKNAQDKYRQINHYIDILSSLIKDIPAEQIKKVADMGSGKGYLTFALYDYLHNVLNIKAEVTGVEFRPDMVALCNDIAVKSKFDELRFVEGTIEDYDSANTNILIALHACDTATDDAIAKGIAAKAELIVVAPCCHKQVRREIEKNKTNNDLDFLTKHGIFMERQAEMVTDGIRAMVLEYFG
ncbi:MAG: SAM-dependent methyltransferase, partial [Flavipsychrobacter sp.]|nr:SAM-dependent methyltransferase [Flavipsychrobacter sp.]